MRRGLDSGREGMPVEPCRSERPADRASRSDHLSIMAAGETGQKLGESVLNSDRDHDRTWLLDASGAALRISSTIAAASR